MNARTITPCATIVDPGSRIDPAARLAARHFHNRFSLAGLVANPGGWNPVLRDTTS